MAERRSLREPTCADCYFKQKDLCALQRDKPCTTFRPAEAGLRPPAQLRMLFANRAARGEPTWVFPSARERAALYASERRPTNRGGC